MAKCKDCGRTIQNNRKRCIPCDDIHDHKVKKNVGIGVGVVAVVALIGYGLYSLFKK